MRAMAAGGGGEDGAAVTPPPLLPQRSASASALSRISSWAQMLPPRNGNLTRTPSLSQVRFPSPQKRYATDPV